MAVGPRHRSAAGSRRRAGWRGSGCRRTETETKSIRAGEPAAITEPHSRRLAHSYCGQEARWQRETGRKTRRESQSELRSNWSNLGRLFSLQTTDECFSNATLHTTPTALSSLTLHGLAMQMSVQNMVASPLSCIQSHYMHSIYMCLYFYKQA